MTWMQQIVVVLLIVGLFLLFAYALLALLAFIGRTTVRIADTLRRGKGKPLASAPPSLSPVFRHVAADVKSHACFRNSEASALSLSEYIPVGIAQRPFERRPWVSEFDNIVRRPTDAGGEILIDELDDIQIATAPSLKTQLETRRKALDGVLKNYPVQEPSAPQITAPQMPVLVTEEDVVSMFSAYDLSEQSRRAVLSDVEQINAKVEASFLAARQRYDAAVKLADKNYRRALTTWQEHRNEWQQERLAELRDIDQCVADLTSSDDIEFLAELIVGASKLPRWLPNNIAALFDKSTRILIVELEFPNVEELTFLKAVQLRRGDEFKPVNQKERRAAVAKLYPLLALRIATDLAQQLPVGAVEFIAVNGWVNFRSKSTGALQRAYCAALGAKTEDLKVIELEHVDPVVAFSSLKGNSSRSTELTPIAPTIRIDLDDPRYVDSREILRNLEAGENLAAMDWEDFEHLCRELFERVFASTGAIVKVTQASRDQGVDAVITDPDPIRGGKIVVQAKRYVNVVDVSAVRDLAGTVAHEGAMKGLLVTTSHFGPEAYAFVQGKPLQLINGAELLGLLEKHGYKFRIDLDEARRLQREAGTPGFAKR